MQSGRSTKPQKLTKALARQRILIFGIAGATLIFVAGLVYFSSAQKEIGRSVPLQGDAHVGLGQPHPAYNTTPPTSGWHYEATASWGVHSDPIPDEVQIHNLEHGGVMVQYNCECPELVEKLKNVAMDYRSKVILAPYPKMETKIALTAWGHIAELNDFDENAIRGFIKAYRNKGPEQVPD